ncbi:M1 family aminopeptidase [Algoriphagus halophytocola]|uniref:M1 family aminopeptidase n=1 Tax=Algoriphagus halophytocola TaxID=2991499 RepID=A0ABY6MHQ1_9BACT|nr:MULTISPECIES: M1 family aminopeptidase [unclassified Algoriphagus]UZD23148.1 M1 family aminopeptidase [Algoriphagus sp. TR-M5]WBL44440.1 M1 family aminopeptidase [Algoriphagus sp. TR-M9]
MQIKLAKPILGLFLLMGLQLAGNAQTGRFQQAADYKMDVEMDVNTNQYQGTQVLVYTNNSPDTLDRVFYHLYYNAFQPGSMMDERSRTIADPDRRVGDRISKLKPDEIGYMHVNSLTMDGKVVEYAEVGTILEVELAEPILPNTSVIFEMDFSGQVPVQIRRSGRDSAEGVRYSMSQWYPKMSEYDEQGWHANPYIGREFYGIWGDFEVNITIDKSYTVGGTGYLQNPNEIGHGYEDQGVSVPEPAGDKLTWKFKAPNVHDFMWAADPKYRHDKVEMSNGITVHHLYIPSEETTANWEKLKEYTPKAIAFISEHYGQYPYKQFSVIQGGDGGMEYPMSTLITGGRSLGSLVGVMVHELAHSWYQGVLATNEALYPWMDEGFTSYVSSLTMSDIFKASENPTRGSYAGYYRLAKSGLEEPMSTHADHYHTNSAYGSASYSKGAVFVAQMGYIIGDEARDQGMLNYFNTWKFKHPNANDFVRIMEKQSGLELDWYKEYFVYTTKTIDYAVKAVNAKENTTEIILERVGLMPMPIDLVITYKDGSQEMVYLPLEIMRGEKPVEEGMPTRILSEDWPWTNLVKKVTIPRALDTIKSIEIDPSKRMADINPDNNKKEF